LFTTNLRQALACESIQSFADIRQEQTGICVPRREISTLIEVVSAQSVSYPSALSNELVRQWCPFWYVGLSLFAAFSATMFIKACPPQNVVFAESPILFLEVPFLYSYWFLVHCAHRQAIRISTRATTPLSICRGFVILTDSTFIPTFLYDRDYTIIVRF